MEGKFARRARAAALALTIAAAALLAFAASPALATHVSCGAVITEDTTLDSDLENCPETGIEIGADGITLDLNGHEIEGTGVPSYTNTSTAEYGVEVEGHSGVTIENGEIAAFEYGVELDDADGNRVRNLDIYGTAYAVGAYDADDNQIVGNTSINNSYAFYSERANANRVESNRIRGSSIAIYPIESDRNVIARNVIVGSGVIGIQVTTNSDGNLVRANTVDGSLGLGILVSATTGGNRIVANSISNHAISGITLSFASNVVVADNVLRNNFDQRGAYGEGGSFGIVLNGSAHDNRLTGNVVTGSRDGIAVRDSDRNLLSENAVRANTRDGVYVAADSQATEVIRTRAEENQDDGIDVDAAGTLIRANTANRNGDLGIEAVAGVVDGGGNRASGNGDPAQCLNVSCR